MSYGTPDEFRTMFAGTGGRISQLLQTTDESEQDSLIQVGLDAAYGEMQASFKAAGYSIPVDPATSGAFEDFNTALFIRHEQILALPYLAIGTVGMPEDIKNIYEASQQWLKDVQGSSAFNDIGDLTYTNPRKPLAGFVRA